MFQIKGYIASKGIITKNELHKIICKKKSKEIMECWRGNLVFFCNRCNWDFNR